MSGEGKKFKANCFKGFFMNALQTHTLVPSKLCFVWILIVRAVPVSIALGFILLLLKFITSIFWHHLVVTSSLQKTSLLKAIRAFYLLINTFSMS